MPLLMFLDLVQTVRTTEHEKGSHTGNKTILYVFVFGAVGLSVAMLLYAIYSKYNHSHSGATRRRLAQRRQTGVASEYVKL